MGHLLRNSEVHEPIGRAFHPLEAAQKNATWENAGRKPGRAPSFLGISKQMAHIAAFPCKRPWSEGWPAAGGWPIIEGAYISKGGAMGIEEEPAAQAAGALRARHANGRVESVAFARGATDRKSVV